MDKPNQLADTLPRQAAADLSSFENALSEQAFFLAPLSTQIASRWSELYLHTFGRGAFFPPERVQKVLSEMTGIFIGCLKDKCLDVYFENLRDRGRVFSRLGVPFEEVLISMHLFEEVCVEHFLELYPERSKLTAIILAAEELHSRGLSIIATSYFETSKKEMQRITESLREDNEELREELSKTKSSLFVVTRKEMQSMQLAISSINHKMKTRLSQLARIQKIAEALEHEKELPKLMNLAAGQLKRLCPLGSEVIFGIVDELTGDLLIYAEIEAESGVYAPAKQMRLSEVAASFRNAMNDVHLRYQHFKAHSDIPHRILELFRLRSRKEFLFLPVRHHEEGQGFVLISSDSEGFFSKTNYRFFQRVGQVISQAFTAALAHERLEQERRLSRVLDDVSRRKAAKRTLEAIDACLAALIEVVGAERCSLMRYEPARKELTVYAVKGERVFPISGSVIRWGEGIAGMALQTSKTYLIDRMLEKPAPKKHFMGWILRNKPASRAPVKSLLCIPLYCDTTPLGVLNLSTISGYKSFDRAQVELARPLLKRLSDILREAPLSHGGQEMVRL